MSLSTEALKIMLEKGLTLADVIEISEAMDVTRDVTVLRDGDVTRSPSAERQARYRERKRYAGDVTRDVTPSPSLDKETPQTPKEIKPSPLPPVPSDEGTAPIPLNGHSENQFELEPDPPQRLELKPEHVIEAWNDLAGRIGLPAVKKLTETRRRQLASRIRQNTIEDFQTALAAIERSQFLRGENERGWRADFDFLLQPKSFAKLIEGAYDH